MREEQKEEDHSFVFFFVQQHNEKASVAADSTEAKAATMLTRANELDQEGETSSCLIIRRLPRPLSPPFNSFQYYPFLASHLRSPPP